MSLGRFSYRQISEPYCYHLILIPRYQISFSIDWFQSQDIGSVTLLVNIRSVSYLLMPTASYWIDVGIRRRQKRSTKQATGSVLVDFGIGRYQTSTVISWYQWQGIETVSVSVYIGSVLVLVDSNAKLSDQYLCQSVSDQYHIIQYQQQIIGSVSEQYHYQLIPMVRYRISVGILWY